MAINDAEHTLSDAQALTATASSTNLIDFGSDRNIGIGEPMSVVYTLDVAADATSGDETYTAAVQWDSTTTFAGGATVVTGPTVTITRGDAAGTQYVANLGSGTAGLRYMNVLYTLGGTTPTVTVTAQLVPTSFIQNATTYADGFTITG